MNQKRLLLLRVEFSTLEMKVMFVALDHHTVLIVMILLFMGIKSRVKTVM